MGGDVPPRFRRASLMTYPRRARRSDLLTVAQIDTAQRLLRGAQLALDILRECPDDAAMVRLIERNTDQTLRMLPRLPAPMGHVAEAEQLPRIVALWPVAS